MFQNLPHSYALKNVRALIGPVLLLSLIITTGCRNTPTVVKIGLVAPFEGGDRAVGYDAIYAARLAVRQINRNGGIDGAGTRVALVALDDGGDLSQAQRNGALLISDPAVVAVIGHGLERTTTHMIEHYAGADLPLIPLSHEPFGPFDPSDLPPNFSASYEAVTPFDEQPGPLAGPTYDGINLIIEAMVDALAAGEPITRQSVAKYLPKTSHQGITGTVTVP